MVLSNGTRGWGWRYGPTTGRWLQEEFDDLGRDHQNGRAMSVTQANAEDAGVRLHAWKDEADYDEPGTGSGCRERVSPFPDPYELIHRDWEK